MKSEVGMRLLGIQITTKSSWKKTVNCKDALFKGTSPTLLSRSRKLCRKVLNGWYQNEIWQFGASCNRHHCRENLILQRYFKPSQNLPTPCDSWTFSLLPKMFRILASKLLILILKPKLNFI
jgi:hypothetical protein